MLYVPSFTNAGVYQVEAGDPAKTNFRYDRGSMLGLPNASIDGLPLFKAPYSRVTAIAVNRGEHAWMTPLGDGPRQHPLIKALKLPALVSEAARW
jgi:quinoprotein glucose dehydrogenase